MRVLPDRLVALLFALAIALTAPAAPVAAQPAPAAESCHAGCQPSAPAPALTGLAGALAHFLEDDFSETDTGITEVAASGDPRALTIIEALQDGRLSYSAEQKKVFYKDKAGKLIDAVTGAPAAGAEPADLGDVRVNNRVRRALDAAVGSLSLQAADPAKRFESAQAVFKSREQSALPALDAALEKETDPRIKQALTEARAAVVLYSDDASEADKLTAVGVVRARGDQECVEPARRPAGRLAGRGSARRARRASPRCRTSSRSGPPCRTPGMGCRSARCCCSRRSGLPSPSA